MNVETLHYSSKCPEKSEEKILSKQEKRCYIINEEINTIKFLNVYPQTVAYPLQDVPVAVVDKEVGNEWFQNISFLPWHFLTVS